MPLMSGSSPAAVSANIAELTAAPKKRSRKQIIAIALSKAGKSRPNKIALAAGNSSTS